MPCCLSIWVKTTEEQLYNSKKNSSLFIFTTKENADLAVRRVGGKTGKVLEGLEHSESTTYFIKILKDYEKVYLAFKSITLDIINNTAGVRSISKPELISLVEYQYNLL